ncbi:MAG: type I restriction-modification system subunit M, partial [Bacteroidota bacterium]
MTQESHNRIVAFIWSIADDCLRDVYVRGKYRDVILPMVVLRRLDALLEETKEEVMKEFSFQRKEIGITNWGDLDALRRKSGYKFYNTSKWTLKLLYKNASNTPQILQQNLIEYIDGYSDNVREILSKFDLKSKIRHMTQKDVLLDVLEKFTSEDINLTDKLTYDSEGRKLPPLTNLGMGYVFEELIRRFNEENNEEAGEHFTPREVIELMTHIILEPVKDDMPSVVTVYDPACGTGGMLTETQNFIKDQNGNIKFERDVHLYGKEINDETYAICKSDMIIKGNDPRNIKSGSTLSTDSFADTTFNYMLSNPPYGKSWNSEKRFIMDGKEVLVPRFLVPLKDYWGEMSDQAAIPRSSDGQLLFLMEMIDKMKSLKHEKRGSRIASVHNGSSLFTGDAGSGESNIRRYIIENDMLDCIIQLPNNLFYNTGITTYIWILTNKKPENRKGKVLLIDAGELYKKLRKNLGAKNCEFTQEHIRDILQVYMQMEEKTREGETGLSSKLFDNADFGYYKVTIQRPKRLKAQFAKEKAESLRYDDKLREVMQWMHQQFGDEVYDAPGKFEKKTLEWCEKESIELTRKQTNQLKGKKLWQKHKSLYDKASSLLKHFGKREYNDYNRFVADVNAALKKPGLKCTDSEKKTILHAMSWYDETAEKVIKKRVKLTGNKLEALLNQLDCTKDALPDYGWYPGENPDEYILYESESSLRDYEQVPIKENIYNYYLREVKPHVPEAWIDMDATRIGCEISFNKYFYQHKKLRSLEEVTADILALEKENEGLMDDILN